MQYQYDVHNIIFCEQVIFTWLNLKSVLFLNSMNIQIIYNFLWTFLFKQLQYEIKSELIQLILKIDLFLLYRPQWGSHSYSCCGAGARYNGIAGAQYSGGHRKFNRGHGRHHRQHDPCRSRRKVPKIKGTTQI